MTSHWLYEWLMNVQNMCLHSDYNLEPKKNFDNHFLL